MKLPSLKNLFKKKNDDISSAKPNRVKKFVSRLSKKQRILAAVLAVAIVFGSVFAWKSIFGKDENTKGEITALAQIGNVSSVIEGSGTIEALQQYDITSLIKGEVVADYFEEGDIVEKDAVLYRMDDETGHEAVDNALSSVNRARRSYNNATEDIANLVVKSKSSGTVTSVYIEKGDSVNANAKVADVIDNNNMILEIQFLENYAKSMTAGVSRAEVTLTKNGTVLNGTVTKISSGSVLSSVGSKVTNVEITVQNPGAIKDGDYATAEVAGFSCSSEGVFKNAGKSTIYTKVSGNVEDVYIMAGDTVSNGQNVAILSNDNITDISETRENYEDAQKKYNDAVEGLEDYVVKAPISGTIIQKNIKAGEKLENNSNGSVMAIIADLSSLVFQMSVDELDISKLSEGMDVEVTADAIENVTFSAKVTNISIVGSSNNGVTSYPVKITVNPKEQQNARAYQEYDKLIPGMNVSASVVIERAENVIVVPVSAVRRGNIVIVSEDSKSEGVGFNFAPSMPKRQNNSASSDASDNKKDKTSLSNGNMPQKNYPKGNMPDGWKMRSDGERPQDIKPPHENSKPQSAPDKNLKSQSSENKNTDTKNDKTSNTDKAKERMQAMIDALDIPDGYKAIIVETGLSDESFIEIKNGLSEGDKVLLPDTTRASSNPMGMMGMPGAMGGMPGGMGGMSGGNRNMNFNRNTGTNRTGSTNRNFGAAR